MRTLIVERHGTETGGAGNQVQIPTPAFTAFFSGPGTVDVDVYSPGLPPRSGQAEISSYAESGTHRINGVPELATIPRTFVIIQEDDPGVHYTIWWEFDLPLVAAKFDGWEKAQDSQYGRGRLWTLVEGPPLPRPITW